jgi:hypothetical protein
MAIDAAPRWIQAQAWSRWYTQQHSPPDPWLAQETDSESWSIGASIELQNTCASKIQFAIR